MCSKCRSQKQIIKNMKMFKKCTAIDTEILEKMRIAAEEEVLYKSRMVKSLMVTSVIFITTVVISYLLK